MSERSEHGRPVAEMPWVSRNGVYLPPSEALVSVFDRGLLYGDSLFETQRVVSGHPVWFEAHWSRWTDSARELGIPIPVEATAFRHHLEEGVRLNALQDGVVRWQVTRGVGARGYAPPELCAPNVLLTFHPGPLLSPRLPSSWSLIKSSFTSASFDPLVRWKTGSKFMQVLAKQEASQAGADDALLFNEHDEATETSSGNLFVIHSGKLVTPPLSCGLLPGVTRQWVLRHASARGHSVEEASMKLDDVFEADAVFITMASRGIIPIHSLGGRTLSEHPRVDELYQAYRAQCLPDAPEF